MVMFRLFNNKSHPTLTKVILLHSHVPIVVLANDQSKYLKTGDTDIIGLL